MKKILPILIALAFFFPLSALASNQIFMGNASNYINSTTNLYINGANSAGVNVANDSRNGLLPIAGTFSNLYAYTSAAPGGSASWTVTLEDATNLESVTCTITSAATTCNDTTHTFTAAAGDNLSIQFKANSSPAKTPLYFSIQFTPATPNQTALIFNNVNTFSTTAENYTPLAWGVQAINAGETNQAVIIPEGGTFKNFYMTLHTALTSGSDVFTVKNSSTGATTTITCTISSTTCNDTTHTYATSSPASGVIGDRMDLANVPASPSSAAVIGGGIGFTPTTAGDFDFIAAYPGGNANSQRFTPFNITASAPFSVEASSTEYAQAMTITSMQVHLNASPGAGKTRTFTIRQNSGTSTAACTVDGSASNVNDCVWNGSLSVALGDTLDVVDVPTAGATAAVGAISIIAKVPSAPVPAVGGKNKLWSGFLRFIGGFFRFK